MFHGVSIWQPYDHPMHTYENPMKHLWEVSQFHCILCGAKRRGKILSGFTVYYAARSAAAKFYSVFTVHYAKSFEIFEIHPNSSVLSVYYAARCAAALNWVGLL